MKPLFTQTPQVAMVVPDLDAAMKAYVECYGIGPWRVFDFNPGNMADMTVHGEPAEYAMRIGVATVGSVSWELIQPLDDRSIYAEFLRIRGPGLHHVQVVTGNYADALSAFLANGHQVLQGGVYKGVRFAYLGTETDLGAIIEIIDMPSDTVLEPDEIYPPAR